jgi:hypothetical protein
MSLWIYVHDANNGNPITDAQFGGGFREFGGTAGSTYYNEGNGWYYVQIGSNTTFTVCATNLQYDCAVANTDASTSMSIGLTPVKTGW